MTEKEPRYQYNGWEGKGDSLASARYTWLTALWLGNNDLMDRLTHHIVNTQATEDEKATWLLNLAEAWVNFEVGNQAGLGQNIAVNVLRNKVNWKEIITKFRE